MTVEETDLGQWLQELTLPPPLQVTGSLSAARQFIKEQLGTTPREMFGYLGYGLFAGRK